jgi:hypothetical protein
MNTTTSSARVSTLLTPAVRRFAITCLSLLAALWHHGIEASRHPFLFGAPLQTAAKFSGSYVGLHLLGLQHDGPTLPSLPSKSPRLSISGTSGDTEWLSKMTIFETGEFGLKFRGRGILKLQTEG